MRIVIERKNRRALTLPSPGRAITLAFLQTIAVLIALWCVMTGGGRRFRRLARQDAFEYHLLRVMIRRRWQRGDFAHDPPISAVKRLWHMVIAVAWHEELRSRQMPDPRAQRRAACTHSVAPSRPAPCVVAHDTS